MLRNRRPNATFTMESVVEAGVVADNNCYRIHNSIESIKCLTLNKSTMKIKMMVLCVMLSGGIAFAQHDHAKHGDQKKDENMVMFKDARIGTAYSHYIHLKDALVASKSDEAKNGAGELQKALKGVEGAAAAIELSAKIFNLSDLTEQRKFFSTLSNEMATLVKGAKLSMGMVYLEYCPMANSNTGAFWLSNEKEIKNPYFGDAMLKCGSVKEMIH